MTPMAAIVTSRGGSTIAKRAAPCCVGTVNLALAQAVGKVTPSDAQGWFEHAGHLNANRGTFARPTTSRTVTVPRGGAVLGR